MRHNPLWAVPFVFRRQRRKVRVKLGEQLRDIWRQATKGSLLHGERAGRESEVGVEAAAERRTLAMPAIMSPVHFPGKLLPKPTPVNLRRFA